MTKTDLIRWRVLQEPAGRLRHNLRDCVKEATEIVEKLCGLVPDEIPQIDGKPVPFDEPIIVENRQGKRKRKHDMGGA